MQKVIYKDYVFQNQRTMIQFHCVRIRKAQDLTIKLWGKEELVLGFIKCVCIL